MFNLAPGGFQAGEIFCPNFFGSRGEKIFDIIIGYRVLNMSNAKTLYCLLNSCKRVIGGYQIELQAMGGIIILFLLYQNND